jgi:hypothetical protein
MKDNLKKMEDDLKKWKITSKNKGRGEEDKI